MTARSPFTAFRGERLPGLGHNQGPPLDSGISWRRFSWAKARRELVPRLPLEVVRRRIARAKQLGLEYPQYASILLGTGRDIVAFLYTADALGIRVQRTPRLPEATVHKLKAIEGCEQLLTGEAAHDPTALARLIERDHHIALRGTGALPGKDAAAWSEGRDAIRNALRPFKIPTDAVVMIGTEAHERAWADAARLAKFLPSEQFFPGQQA